MIHTNGLKEKSHTIICIVEEKAFDETQYAFMVQKNETNKQKKNPKSVGLEETFFTIMMAPPISF